MAAVLPADAEDRVALSSSVKISVALLDRMTRVHGPLDSFHNPSQIGDSQNLRQFLRTSFEFRPVL